MIFYLTSFLNSLANGFIGPLFIVYLLSINFNPAQIGILLATERLTNVIFEFPTGIFADKYGRKKSILLSFLLTSLIFIFWFFSKDFYFLLVLSIFWGIAYTFQSGAKESLMIDSLKLDDNDSLRTKIFSKISIFGQVGFIIGSIIAASLAFFFIRYIWLAASLMNLILFFLFLFLAKEMTSTHYNEKQFQLKEILKTAKDNLKLALRTRTILIFLIFTILVGIISSIYNLSYPIMFKQQMNLPNYYFGLLGSFSAAVGIMGTILAERLSRKRGYYFTLSFFSLALLTLFFAFGLSKILIFALLCFGLIELILFGWYPISQSLFNKFIPGEVRSGILSLASTISIIAIATGEITAGFLLHLISPNVLIILSGLLFVFIPPLILEIKNSVSKI